MNSNTIKDFYSKIQFPGRYTKKGLDFHKDKIKNPYLNVIDQYIDNEDFVLDVGCGTGLISNLFASKYKENQFIGIDFSDSIFYASAFADYHNIKNVEFIKSDYVLNEVDKYFDVVVCQGVLHHIPEYKYTAEKLMKNVKPGGYLIVGLYHPAGKLLKQFFSLDYGNDILYQDQEENPYETDFTVKESLDLFKDFNLVDSYPSINMLTSIKSFINFKSGGLITYVFQKPLD